MADVYRVWDNKRSVYLAIKVLQEDLAEDEIFLRRFRREAETLSRLQHPFIIRSYGLVQADDLAFLVMDFIEGSTLRKEIFSRKAPWSPDQVISVMRPVCAALNFAHTQGFVHCDVKPANIMLTSNGDVLLADFGIARLTESATTATLVGAGTPAYMAPEQIQGEDPLPQTDVYALGVILFELLTGGERPFTGEHAQTTGSSSEKVRWEQIHRDPPSPRIYNPDILANIETIVFKCMAKNPKDRYSRTMDFETALEQAYPNVIASVKPTLSAPISRPFEPPAAGGYTRPPANAPVTPPSSASSTPPYSPPQMAEPTGRKLPVPFWMILVVLAVMVFFAVFAFSPPPAVPTAAPTQAPGNYPSSTPGAAVTATQNPGILPTNLTTAPATTQSLAPTYTETLIPSATNTAVPTKAGDIARLAPFQPHTGEKLPYEQWQKWPVLPVVSQRAKDIYQRGLARNNDPKKFSKIGDWHMIRQDFLGYFDDGDQSNRLGGYYSKLKEVLQNFHGSYTRVSMSVRTGLNVASVLSAINSDPQICKAGETPLQCEFRVWNPSIAIISMETWTKDRPTTAYEGYLRQIVDFVIARDVMPILATKADNLEGDHSINAMVARVAAEYDIPLWNFWTAADPLPSHGLLEDGFHLTNGPNNLTGDGLLIAWNMRNLTALQALDKVWREVSAKK